MVNETTVIVFIISAWGHYDDNEGLQYVPFWNLLQSFEFVTESK